MLNTNKDQWRGMQVLRDRKHDALVKQLCTPQNNQPAIFSFIKDLMVFAAMVGYSKNRRSPLDGNGIQITLATYSSDQKDSFIYLLALITEKDATILKDENLPQAISIFEEFCNAGLEEIRLWLDEKPGDHVGVDTLIEKIFAQVVENESSMSKRIAPEDIDVDF